MEVAIPDRFTPVGPQSEKWLREAIDFTRPVSWRTEVVCNDDCENCPLFVKERGGCARNCNRYDSQVCFNCPCLASIGVKHAQEQGFLATVDPNTDAPREPTVEIAKNAQ